MKPRHRLQQHIRDNRWQYLLITLIFFSGVIMGDYKTTGLTSGVKNHLLTLIDEYLKGGVNVGLDKQVILFNSFINQAKSIVAVWFLGLTIIGMPIILGVVFLKGFSLGFTVSFLVKAKAMSGVMISILSILPQNLVFIPLLIIWSVVGINFTIYIAKGRSMGGLPLSKGFISYTVLLLISLVIVLIGSLIEAYLSPWFLSFFI